MSVRVGIDTGGTFTDFVLLEDGGAMRVHKVRSVPSDPSEAIFGGLKDLVGEALDAEITHGSTVATNAVLERKGARIALVTTAGFEDVLLIGRQTRAELYNFMVAKAKPLVEDGLTFGVRERLAFDGAVIEPLAGVEELVATLTGLGVESVAVCLLHSYANPAHERVLAGALRGAGMTVSASHEILPEYREFERWSTTAVNAYVAPLMARYLTRLEERLGAGAGRLRVMQSNGGSISAGRAKTEAVQTILSGPAAGVVGAQALARASGFERVITFDMGGTSTDVSLVDGRIGTTMESLVGDLPVRLAVLDIHTVGAGGGSIAWLDEGGSLRVGPRSAGADPGPVCYGVGTELTVTDANLLLGRLDAGFFLGGRMQLDVGRTKAAAKALGARLGLSERALAEGMVRIANAHMERAIRVVSVQRGFDPRDFALLAFGGAGGLHACDLAESLDIGTVVIPEHAGVLSALGMLLADVVKDYSGSVLRASDGLTMKELLVRLAPLVAKAHADLAAEGFAAEEVLLKPALAMRYTGQSFEIDVPMVGAEMEALVAEFHARHERLYGYANPLRATEAVQLRLRAVGRTEKPVIACAELSGDAPVAESVGTAVFDGKDVDTPVFHRGGLKAGMGGAGAAMIVSGESTTVVPPGWAWRMDGVGSLVLTRGARAD